MAITTYQRPAFAEAAVRSCLNQGPLRNRVIVVDDASEDAAGERIAANHDPRVIYQCRAENGGIGTARRDVFNLSEADWTLTLDSNHELLPGALGSLARLSKTNVGKVGKFTESKHVL